MGALPLRSQALGIALPCWRLPAIQARPCCARQGWGLRTPPSSCGVTEQQWQATAHAAGGICPCPPCDAWVWCSAWCSEDVHTRAGVWAGAFNAVLLVPGVGVARCVHRHMPAQRVQNRKPKQPWNCWRPKPAQAASPPISPLHAVQLHAHVSMSPAVRRPIPVNVQQCGNLHAENSCFRYRPAVRAH